MSLGIESASVEPLEALFIPQQLLKILLNMVSNLAVSSAGKYL